MSRLDTLTDRDIEHLDNPVWRDIIGSGIDPRRLVLAMSRIDWPTVLHEPLPPDSDLQKSLAMFREALAVAGES